VNAYHLLLIIMAKKDIHPKYYKNAKVKCACGNEFTVGSTKPELEIEICSKCHPFYTGRDKVVDTLGQIQKFKTRLEKHAQLKKQRRQKK